MDGILDFVDKQKCIDDFFVYNTISKSDIQLCNIRLQFSIL